MTDTNKISNKVIIWGKDGYNPLGLLRQLYDVAEVTFLLYGGSRLCAVKSRYCTKLHRTNSLEEGMVWLLSEFRNEQQKPFIIPTGDLVAEFIDKNRKKLEPFFYLTGTTEPGLLSKVIDKNYMNQLATECGFLIPKSGQCRWDTDISNVKYPCLLKPDKNHFDHDKDFKTKICSSEEELSMVLGNVSKESCFVLQEYISKEYDALVYGFRGRNGAVSIPGVLMKDRWDKGGDGTHGYLSTNIPSSISLNAIEKFLSKIDYKGLFSVEFGVLDDKAFFYEFNLRNDGTSHYFYQAGVNIPLLWMLDTLGVDFSNYPVKLDGYHDFIAISDDFVNVTSGRITYKQWREDKKRATVFRIYDKKDMRPYYYNMAIVALRPLRNAFQNMKKRTKK